MDYENFILQNNLKCVKHYNIYKVGMSGLFLCVFCTNDYKLMYNISHIQKYCYPISL